MKFKEFGWNGLIFEVLEEARFINESGNSKRGYFRIESEEFLLEFKWEPFQPKKAKPLSEIVEDLTKQMEKSKKQDVTVLKQDSAHVFGHDALYTSLKSDVESRVYIWYCDESERIIICQFAFKAMDNLNRKIMERVLETIKCHSEKSFIWSTMGFRFEVPKSFLITDRKIAVGRAHFLLGERKVSAFAERSKEILVEYFSMANVVFGDTYRNLDEWLQKTYMKDLKKRYKKIKFQIEESRKLKRHNLRIKNGTSTTGLTSRKTSFFTNAIWYCSNSNRIYSITISENLTRPISLKRKIDEEAYKKLIEELLSSFECH